MPLQGLLADSELQLAPTFMNSNLLTEFTDVLGVGDFETETFAPPADHNFYSHNLMIMNINCILVGGVGQPDFDFSLYFHGFAGFETSILNPLEARLDVDGSSWITPPWGAGAPSIRTVCLRDALHRRQLPICYHSHSSGGGTSIEPTMTVTLECTSDFKLAFPAAIFIFQMTYMPLGEYRRI